MDTLLSFGKIRASYGVIGNNNIGNYTQYALVDNSINAVFGNTVASGAAVTTLGNANLGWERTKQFDIGLDLRFFNNRVEFIYDYYKKNTTDLLFNVLLGFTFLFFITILFINPISKLGNVNLKAEYIISVTWPNEFHDDVDTWLQDPAEQILSFRQKEVGLMHLDRDDLGRSNDYQFIQGIGKVTYPYNREIATIRGYLPGEYILNIHLYRKVVLIDGPKPIPVTITLEKINPKVKLIDLSADFRLESPKNYKKWYNITHKSKNLIKHSIYSIPELIDVKLDKFRIIACPGCYPTSIQIPLVPIIKNKLINTKNIIIDSKSGYSGAGKNLHKKFKFKNIYESISAYGVSSHRHIAEIDQQLNKISKNKIKVQFTPHLLPMFRGILSTIYVNLNKNISAKKIYKCLK